MNLTQRRIQRLRWIAAGVRRIIVADRDVQHSIWPEVQVAAVVNRHPFIDWEALERLFK